MEDDNLKLDWSFKLSLISDIVQVGCVRHVDIIMSSCHIDTEHSVVIGRSNSVMF